MKKILTLFIMLMTAAGMTAQVTATEYHGKQNVTVGGTFGPYEHSGATCIITQNADGTLSLTVREYKLHATVIGNLYVSDMTIENIPFDNATGKYSKDYTADGIAIHIKAVSNGSTTMDSDYTVTKLGNVQIALGSGSVSITNNFQPGNMPFPIAATFTGSAAATGIRLTAADTAHSNAAFHISGQHAKQNARGIIIRNGKKYVVR